MYSFVSDIISNIKMTRFTDWRKEAWNTNQNDWSSIKGFIEKAAPRIRNIGNFMSYLQGSIGSIRKTINKRAGVIDSFTGMLPSEMLDKVERYTGKGPKSGNMVQQWIW
ncbi:MAG: hypothetical protein Ta2E_12120 [Mycoplasmoidaceae bacterium]|nr:MAG: hypothetical protein Ta2E_12120 [Mycoplasmoidaceae bacterium]